MAQVVQVQIRKTFWMIDVVRIISPCTKGRSSSTARPIPERRTRLRIGRQLCENRPTSVFSYSLRTRLLLAGYAARLALVFHLVERVEDGAVVIDINDGFSGILFILNLC